MPTICDGRPFTREQLSDLGLTVSRLRTLLEHGEIRRLLRGVYVDSRVEDCVELRTRALRCVVGEEQIVVDRTASWLHGVDTYSVGELAAGAVVEVCALRGATRSRHSVIRGRCRDLVPGDVMDLDRLRVTSPLRTALDLGCHLRRREAYAALCGLARAHDLSATELTRGIERFARRRGVVQLRELASLTDPRVESAREAWTLLAILDAGLPAPQPQHWVLNDGVPTYRLDFAYVAQRTCVEYNGHDWHEATDEQRRSDRDRLAWLRDHGWTVIVVRNGDFTGAALDKWIAELRAALAEVYSTRRW